MKATGSSLRVQARLNEIDRQIVSGRLRLNALKWVGAPVAVMTGAYLSYFLYSRGMGLTENVLAGLGGVGSALLAGVSGYRTVQRQVAELEEEREELREVGSGPV